MAKQDTATTRSSMLAIRPAKGHDTANWVAIRPAYARSMRKRARTRPGRWVYRDTTCDTAKHAPRYGAGSTRHGQGGCDTARPGARRHNAWHNTRHDREEGHDTARGRPATRRCAHGLGTVRMQHAHNLGLGCAHCALDPVLTQCTVFSHCLDHCSQGFQKINK